MQHLILLRRHAAQIEQQSPGVHAADHGGLVSAEYVGVGDRQAQRRTRQDQSRCSAASGGGLARHRLYVDTKRRERCSQGFGAVLLGWPRDVLPFELASEVLRGGLAVAREARCHVGGGHSIDDPEPKYGMAVTGVADPDRLLRNDSGAPGIPLSLSKPLGIGVLNNRHKQTGEVFPQAVETMVALNNVASEAALAAGARCATDVTGFGLLGHLAKLVRASGVTAVVDASAVPYLDAARESAAAGYVSGGTRRNLAWVAPHVDFGSLREVERLLLADAQTSGGLLVAGELPGCPVIGELVERTVYDVIVRG